VKKEEPVIVPKQKEEVSEESESDSDSDSEDNTGKFPGSGMKLNGKPSKPELSKEEKKEKKEKKESSLLLGSSTSYQKEKKEKTEEKEKVSDHWKAFSGEGYTLKNKNKK